MPSQTVAKPHGTCIVSNDARYREECIFASCMSAVDIIAALGTNGAAERKDSRASGLMRSLRSFFSRQPRKRFVVLKVAAKKPRKWAGARDETVARA